MERGAHAPPPPLAVSPTVSVVEPSAAARLPLAYAAYCRQVTAACPDMPRVDITFRGLKYEIRTPHAEEAATGGGGCVEDEPNLFTAVPLAVRHLYRRATRRREEDAPATTVFQALAPCPGYIPAGSMTMIMAPPGHGKSTLLKALSARLLDDPNLAGDLRWNNLSSAEAARRGLHLKRLCAYVEQVDNAFPTLTTRETVEFAVQTSTASLDLLPEQHRPPPGFSLTSQLLALTGLTSCAETLVGGGGGIRGVSGGQRRRVCLAEVLATQARVLCCDEVTTGLDAATTVDIVRSLDAWARLTGGTVIMALLQPSPEVLAEFSHVLLLREGHTVFHGPRAALEPFLADKFQLTTPPDQDFGDFVTAFLGDPEGVRRRAKGKAREHKRFLARRRSNSSCSANEIRTTDSALGDKDTAACAASSFVHHTDVPVSSVPVQPMTSRHVTFHVDASSSLLQDDDTLGEDSNVDPSTHPAMTPLTTASLLAAYQQSEWFAAQSIHAVIAAGETPPGAFDLRTFRSRLSPYVRHQFYSPSPHHLATYLHLLVRRQLRILWRSRQILLPRLAKDLAYGLVAGSLFYQRPLDDYQSKIALAFIGSSALSFSNMSEVTLACEARRVIQMQLDGGTYSSASYILAQALVHIPLSFLETLVFALPVYFLSGFSSGVSGFWFFFFLLFLFNEVMSAMLKSVAFAVSEPSIGQVLVEPLVTLFQAASGFLILRGKIPVGAIFVYWVSPFAWSIRSIVQSEFEADRYDDLIATTDETNGATEFVRRGTAYLRAFQIQTDPAYKWAGVGLLVGYWTLLNLLAAWLLSGKRKWLAVGTKRPTTAAVAADVAKEGKVVPVHETIEMAQLDRTNGTNAVPTNPDGAVAGSRTLAAHPSSAGDTGDASHVSVGLPLIPRSLQWRNVSYYVRADGAHEPPAGEQASTTTESTADGDSDKQRQQRPRAREKQLLSGVDGHVSPGTLCALMGSSGAGKTTLLTVLARRTEEGRSTGDILVNGVEIGEGPAGGAGSGMVGFCTQHDVHLDTATVYESLQFAARLRLPATVTDAAREQHVRQTMEVMELTNLANRRVGDVQNPGLSPGQLKRLTIGLELVANPSILFADEPTSGLSSTAALLVMKVLRRVADTGRTVIVTIHQPSSELFFLFDRLLLLHRGGTVVFDGRLGVEGVDVVNYFESLPVPPPAATGGVQLAPLTMPEHTNPASWILKVIGAGTNIHAAEAASAAKTKANGEGATTTREGQEERQEGERAGEREKGCVGTSSHDLAFWAQQDFGRLYLESDLRKRNQEEWRRLLKQSSIAPAAACSPSPSSSSPYARGTLYQYRLVVSRLFTSYSRNLAYNGTRTIVLLGAAIVFGLLWFDLRGGGGGDSQAGVQSQLSALYFSFYFVSLLQSASILSVVYKWKVLVEHEVRVKTYRGVLFPLAMFLVEVPYLLGHSLMFSVVFYFMVGFRSSAGGFFLYVLLLFLVSLVLSGMGEFWALLIDSQALSKIPQCFMFDFMFLFSGLLLPYSSIPTAWRFMYHLGVVPKALTAAGIDQLECDHDGEDAQPDQCPTFPVQLGDGVVQQTASRYAEDYLSATRSDVWPEVAWLVLSVAAVRMLVCATMQVKMVWATRRR